MSGAKCFFGSPVLAAICERERELLQKPNIYLIETVNRFYGQPRLDRKAFLQGAQRDDDFVLPNPPDDRGDRIGFSKNLRKGFFAASTVPYCATQVAFYLGFRRIFILGMDLDYSGPNPRFYESAAQMQPTRISQRYEPLIKPSFEVLRDVCAREDLKVFNLSSTSRLPADIIPRMSFDEAINESNHELADRIIFDRKPNR